MSAACSSNAGSSSFKYQLIELDTRARRSRPASSSASARRPATRTASRADGTSEHDPPDRRPHGRLPGDARRVRAHGPSLDETRRSPSATASCTAASGSSSRPSSTTLVEINDRRPLRPRARCTTRRTCRASAPREKAFPDVPHVAVFDTAFHQTLAARGVHLRDRRRARRAAPRPPVRLPRHVAQVRLARRPPSSSAARSTSSKTDRAAPRQRGVGLRRRRRPVDRHVDGHDAARGARDGHALRRHRPGRRSSTCTARPASASTSSTTLLNRGSGLLGPHRQRRHARRAGRAPRTATRRAEAALAVYRHRIKHYIGAYLAAARRPRRARLHGRASARTTPLLRRRTLAGLELLGHPDRRRPQRAAVARGAASSRPTARRSRCSSCRRTRSSRSRGRRQR